MRSILFAAAIMGTVATVTSTDAIAQYYPWCSVYNDKGSRNCGFVSFQQCLANVRGIGGVCELNPWAVTPGIWGYSQSRRRR